MKSLFGVAVVALGVATTAMAQEPVRHAVNEVGHATAHAAKTTTKAVRHTANQAGHATAHAAKTTASTTRSVANDAGHATAHAAKTTTAVVRHDANEAGHATAHAAKTIAGTDDAALMRSVRVSEPRARATVLRSYSGAQISEVKLGKEHGRVAWEYSFRSPGVHGKDKVYVDAQTGQLF